jgi:hypothetical protein
MSGGVEHYIVLGLATIIIALLAFAMWRKTESIAFPVGVFFLYFWTLFGAWQIISVLSEGGEIPYLFYRMFPLALDSDYLLILSLYAIFIIVVQLTVLYFAHPPHQRFAARIVEISHAKLIAMAGVLTVAGVLFIGRSVLDSVAENESGYSAVREAPLFSWYQLCLHLAMCQLAIGLAVWMSGREGRFLVGRRSWQTLIGYLVVFLTSIAVCTAVGNRTEVALTFTLLVLFYLGNARRQQRTLLAVFVTTGLVVLTAIKLARDGLFGASGTTTGEVLQYSQKEFVRSAESFAAHMSLYGAIHKQLPFTYGSSFLSLLMSLVPRGLWPDRPAPIYDYYAAGVAATEGQGYTIHHATGWYLNFGVLAVVAGGFVVGLVWSITYNRVYDGVARRSSLNTIFSTLGFWLFTTGLPVILRNGPEVYKQVFFEMLLFPCLSVVVAGTQFVMRANRPGIRFAVEPSETLRNRAICIE